MKDLIYETAKEKVNEIIEEGITSKGLSLSFACMNIKGQQGIAALIHGKKVDDELQNELEILVPSHVFVEDMINGEYRIPVQTVYIQ